jgi:hypothetical protein
MLQTELQHGDDAIREEEQAIATEQKEFKSSSRKDIPRFGSANAARYAANHLRKPRRWQGAALKELVVRERKISI